MESMSPLQVFRFQVEFREESLSPGASSETVVLCKGAFSECTGLEASMEPKEIKEGGRNYGAIQRAGPVSFGTVVLKRGITSSRDLFRWFELVSGGAYAHRLNATLRILGPPVPSDAEGQQVTWTWRLKRCLPIKFKAPDLDAKGTEVGVEELHLTHEGLSLVTEGGGRS